jgi:predicted metal-dependent hydrolase
MLRRGVVHFNRGAYFEAHEAWEAAWLRASGPRAELYKGLVQCAAALHHLRRGNLEGARRLHERQRLRLAAFPPRALGIQIARLVADMDALFAALGRDPRADGVTPAMPVIELDEVEPDGEGGCPAVAGPPG